MNQNTLSTLRIYMDPQYLKCSECLKVWKCPDATYIERVNTRHRTYGPCRGTWCQMTPAPSDDDVDFDTTR